MLMLELLLCDLVKVEEGARHACIRVKIDIVRVSSSYCWGCVSGKCDSK